MANYYPPVGFHFRVDVLGIPKTDHDMRFTEVSGLSAEIGVEEVAEGGENRFIHKFPTRPKYSELILKRGLLINSEITKWIKLCLIGFSIQPKNIDVVMLNEQHEPLQTWHIFNAYPTKWAISDLNASNSAVVIESLQFCYQYFYLDK
jgi:phage tail-like protein